MFNKKKGFTIVELVIVIAVIAILAAVMIPTFSGVISAADESNAMQAARNAYTSYLVESNAAVPTGTNKVYIVVDNEYMFVVDADGFDEVPVIKPDASVPAFTATTTKDEPVNKGTFYNATVYKVTLADTACAVYTTDANLASKELVTE